MTPKRLARHGRNSGAHSDETDATRPVDKGGQGADVWHEVHSAVRTRVKSAANDKWRLRRQ